MKAAWGVSRYAFCCSDFHPSLKENRSVCVSSRESLFCTSDKGYIFAVEKICKQEWSVEGLVLSKNCCRYTVKYHIKAQGLYKFVRPGFWMGP